MIEPLIRRLEERQAQFARDALARPSAKDGFEYGRVCGLYAGLEEAKNIVLGLLEDKDAKDDNL